MRWFTKRLREDTILAETVPTCVSPTPMDILPIESQPKRDYRLEGQRRDAFIVELVRRQGVLTSDLIQLAVSREHFDLPGESRQARLNRLAALADRGYFYRLGRTRSGHIAYGTRKVRKGTQPQIEHDLIGARFGVHLDLALADRADRKFKRHFCAGPSRVPSTGAAPAPRQRPPLASAPPARPARRGSPAGAPRSQAERGAAQPGQAAQDAVG